MINREIAPLREGDKAEVPLSCLTIVEDFGRAFVQSAVIAPLWNGLGQLVTGGHLPHVSIVNEKNAEGNLTDSWAQKFGGAIGMAVDFNLLGKLKLGPFRQVETANTLSLTQRCGQHFMRSAKQGAVYGAVFTESDPSNNFLSGRVANAGSQALTFGLLGAGSEALSGLKVAAKVKPGTFKNALSDMTIAGVAGVPAGAVGAVADASFNGRTLEAKNIQNAAIDFGIIGFALAGINQGVTALSTRHAQMGKHLKSAIENAESLEKASPSTQAPSLMANDILDTRQESATDSTRSTEKRTLDDSLASEKREVRKLLVECLSKGSIVNAERIIKDNSVTEEDLQQEDIREATRQGLVTCLSGKYIETAERIIKSKLVPEEAIQGAVRQALVNCFRDGRIDIIEKLIERKLVTNENLKTSEIQKAVQLRLAKCLYQGSITEVEKLLERKFATDENLKTVKVREAAVKSLIKSLSEGCIDDAEKIIELKLVENKEISDAVQQALNRCLTGGHIETAKRIIEHKLITDEDIQEAVREGLADSLSSGWLVSAGKIVESRLIEEKEIHKAVRQGLIECLSAGRIHHAEKMIQSNWATEEDLKADEIREAARLGLVKCLSNGLIQAAEKIIARKLVEPNTLDEVFRQSVQSRHITNVVRTGLSIGKDFNTIAKEYLGISKLTDEEAGRLFERTRNRVAPWEVDADGNSFQAGSRIFGTARMLRYIFKTNADPHEVLDGFDGVIKMFQGSRLGADDFYNNVLRQVNRDSGVDEIGHSCARLKSIANDYHDNFDHVVEKIKEYPGIVTIQDLAARFPDQASVFSSWTKLQQYSKLVHFINSSELLPKIQELRSSGQLKRAKWVEALAFHADSKVAKEPIEDFLLNNPTDFLERGDKHSSELHEHLKPSNYVEKPHLDLKAEELRDAIIDGSLDRLQSFTPMRVEYEVGCVDLASELKRALGSRKKGQRGEAQSPKKLFKKVNDFLEQDNLTIAKVLQGAELSQDLSVKITGLLYNKEIGLSRPPGSFKLVAEIHKKSDPLAVVAGDDTASCMEFGSGKNNVYMFNPNNALFTIRLERPDGTQRTIAQSVLTKDLDVRELVPSIVEKMRKGEPVLNIFPEEGLRNGKAVIAADNVEVHPNYKSETYKTALEAVYRDFFGRYMELYGEKENLQSDKIIVGLGHGDALESLPKEENTYLPQAPVAYSDKIHDKVSRLSLIAPQTNAVKASVPAQMVRSITSNSKEQAITELTFQDTLPLSHLESKIYQEVPTLTQGLIDLENTLIAKDINNVAKGRPNLSFKYTDKAGKIRGYLLAYEGKVEMYGSEKPAIYIEDFASDSYLEPTKQGEPDGVGGKMLLRFIKSYKQNYLDKGNMMPLFMNARGTTSYALLMKHIGSFGRKYGYSFEMKEADTRENGSNTMHDVLITPKRIEVQAE
ncbi:MAG: hypothetical protein K2Y22_02310 [Candidatus Obscuribacterales bacterium]|nr:hypothetical protein [Candidatus Obscuribacterales bacterium]